MIADIYTTLVVYSKFAQFYELGYQCQIFWTEKGNEFYKPSIVN